MDCLFFCMSPLAVAGSAGGASSEYSVQWCLAPLVKLKGKASFGVLRLA